MIKVLVVDPSFRNTGWAVIHAHAKGERAVNVGVIRTKKGDGYVGEDNERCSRIIASKLDQIIRAHKPVVIFAEAQAGSKSSKASQLMGMGWGVLATCAELHGLPIVQARPQQIKKALTGDKSATKEEIERVVALDFPELETMLEELKPKSVHEHVYDAVAVFVALRDEVANYE